MSNQLIPNEDFQTVVPSEEGLFTVRTLNTESLSNNGLLDDFQTVDTIPPIDITAAIYTDTDTNIQLAIADIIPTIKFSTGTCIDLNNLPEFKTINELIVNLCETMIRFDTSPKNYQKGDYEQLIKTITNSLTYLYDRDSQIKSLVSDKYFRYNQNTTSKVWHVNHNLNKFPSVTITTSSGNVVEGEVMYTDLNNLTITFSAGFNGYADLN